MPVEPSGFLHTDLQSLNGRVWMDSVYLVSQVYATLCQ